MTIVELLLHPGLRPFEVAVGIVAALLLVEIVANQLGLSLIGDSDADADLDLDVDVDLDLDLDLEVDFDVMPDAEFDIADSDIELMDAAEAEGDLGQLAADAGPLSWLGMGSVPMIIWLTGVLTSFGLVGYFLQLASSYVLGSPMNAWLASVIVLLPALTLGGRTARFIGRLFPKNATTAIARRSYGKRRGVITVGTARSGKPAQARFVDGYGNFHYAMVVPMDANEEIPQGSEVAIFRGRDGVLKAVNLSK